MGGSIDFDLVLVKDAPTFEDWVDEVPQPLVSFFCRERNKMVTEPTNSTYPMERVDYEDGQFRLWGSWEGTSGTGRISDYIMWLDKKDCIVHGTVFIDPYYSPWGFTSMVGWDLGERYGDCPDEDEEE